MKNQNVTGIILAGGKSKRMGKEKGLVELQGKKLINYVIEALDPIAENIIISSNTKAYHYLEYEAIPDIYPNSGPMGGIYSCIKHSSNKKNLVVSCDIPFITADLLNSILAFSDDYNLIVPWHGKKLYEPLCAYYDKNLQAILLDFIKRNNFRIPDVFEEVNFKAFDLNEYKGYNKNLFLNINSKSDLYKARNIPIQKPGNHYPNVMVIGGSGRKVGKTTLACELIGRFANEGVTGIKISPHYHPLTSGLKIIHQTKNYLLAEETDPESSKNTSSMLKAGAEKVYFIQTKDEGIEEALQKNLSMIEKNKAVIIESGKPVHYIKPGLSIFIEGDIQKKVSKNEYDIITKMNDRKSFSILENIRFENNSWQLKQTGL